MEVYLLETASTIIVHVHIRGVDQRSDTREDGLSLTRDIRVGAAASTPVLGELNICQ